MLAANYWGTIEHLLKDYIRIQADSAAEGEVYGTCAVVPIAGQWPEQGLRIGKKERYAKLFPFLS